MNFPNFPGIPALKTAPLAAATLIASGVIQKGLNFFKPQWGIYDGQTDVFHNANIDSFVALDYTNNQNVSQYPVEQGSFTTYNKVKTPFRLMVTIAKGGSVSERSAFMAIVESLNDSLDLFTVITPERVYKNCNVERYDIRRDAFNGAGLMVVSLHFTEVRTATATTSSTKAPTPQPPSAQTMVSIGQIQAGVSTAVMAGVL